MTRGIIAMKSIPYDEQPHISREAQKERLRRVMANELTEKQRRAVEDYYLGGMRQTEMAALYGVHKSTVSRTLRRAVRKLRRFMRY